MDFFCIVVSNYPFGESLESSVGDGEYEQEDVRETGNNFEEGIDEIKEGDEEELEEEEGDG